MVHIFNSTFNVLLNYRPPHAPDFFQELRLEELRSNPYILYPGQAQVLHSLPTDDAPWAWLLGPERRASDGPFRAAARHQQRSEM